MTYEQAQIRYGDIKAGIWLREPVWCDFLDVPEDIGKSWFNKYGHTPVRKIYCNKDLQGPLLQSLENVKNRGLLSELKTFDGCFNIRGIRGENGVLSAHSYAIAIDINASENPLGGPAQMSMPFVRCFTDTGLNWGGAFHRCDPMHFSLGW